jgi:hypothetical protein
VKRFENPQMSTKPGYSAIIIVDTTSTKVLSVIGPVELHSVVINFDESVEYQASMELYRVINPPPSYHEPQLPKMDMWHIYVVLGQEKTTTQIMIMMNLALFEQERNDIGHLEQSQLSRQ